MAPFLYTGDPTYQPEADIMKLRPVVRTQKDIFGTPIPAHRPGIALGNLLSMIGLKSDLDKYKKKGMSLAQIFERFSTMFDRYKATAGKIPRGSAQKALGTQISAMDKIRSQIAPAFAPGNRAGSKDEGLLSNFAAGVKAIRKQLDAAVKFYGIRETVPDVDSAAATKEVERRREEGQGGDLLLYGGLAAAALLGLAAFSRKKR